VFANLSLPAHVPTFPTILRIRTEHRAPVLAHAATARPAIAGAKISTPSTILWIRSEALAHASTAALAIAALLPTEAAVAVIRLEVQALSAAASLSGSALVPAPSTILAVVLDDGAGAAALLVGEAAVATLAAVGRVGGEGGGALADAAAAGAGVAPALVVALAAVVGVELEVAHALADAAGVVHLFPDQQQVLFASPLVHDCWLKQLHALPQPP
jgi:hypothetical protein